MNDQSKQGELQMLGTPDEESVEQVKAQVSEMVSLSDAGVVFTMKNKEAELRAYGNVGEVIKLTLIAPELLSRLRSSLVLQLMEEVESPPVTPIVPGTGAIN